MPRFHYEATDADDKPTAGELEAADAKELVVQLEAMGLRVRSILEAPAAESVEAAKPVEANSADRTTPRMSANDFRQLAEQLSHLTEAELPLAPGLKAFAAELPSGRLRRGLRDVVRRLERGEDVASVLESHKAPDDLVALLRAGIRTGNPGQVLQQYVSHAREFVNIRRRTFLSLGYPLALLVLSIVACISVVAMIVPAFKAIFLDFGVELPGITMLLVRLSDVLSNHGWQILLASVCLVAVGWLCLKLLGGKRFRQRLLYQVPLIGGTLRSASMARFSSLLALIMEEGIPLPEALNLAGSGVADIGLREAAVRLADEISAGGASADSASELSCLPSTFTQALRWEKHGSVIPELLRSMAEMFQQQTRDRTANVAAVCGPVIIVFTGGLLGFLVLGLVLPLVSLVSSLSAW